MFALPVKAPKAKAASQNIPTRAPKPRPGAGVSNQAMLRLLRQRATTTEPTSRAAPGIVHEVLRSAGQPLNPGVRTLMETRFGYDFGQVRVHTDSRAAESARAVNARAYTVGRHVVFGAGQHEPATGRGQRLLAHELAHVLQQRSATLQSESLQIGDAASPSEREADAVAEQALRSETPPALHSTPVALRGKYEEPCPPQPLGDRRRGSERPKPELDPSGNPKCVGKPNIWCKSQKEGCDPKDHEGFPLIQHNDSRNAVGYAQCVLNRMLLEIGFCLAVPGCFSSMNNPPADVGFIRAHYRKIPGATIKVDCFFGADTLNATLALQAYWFKHREDWDGKIGPETWSGLKQK